MAGGRAEEFDCELNTECANMVRNKVIPAINIEAERSAEKFAGNICESEWNLDLINRTSFWPASGKYRFVMNIENDCGQYMACYLIFSERRGSRRHFNSIETLKCKEYR